MRSTVWKLAALSMLLGTSSASGQDVGNVLAALDDAVANTNNTSQSLLIGDANGAINGANRLVTDLIADLADGTPLEETASGLGGNPGQAAQPLIATLGTQLDPVFGPIAEAGTPVLTLANSPALLATLPLIQGENLLLLTEQGSLGSNLGRSGVPLMLASDLIAIDLLSPGDGDGGGVLIPVFGGGDTSAGPALIVELVDSVLLLPGNLEGTPFIAQDMLRLVDFATGNPLQDGSLPIPLIGMVIGDSAHLPFVGSLPLGGAGELSGVAGLDLAQLPLVAEDLDPATLTALLEGIPLPGL